MPAAASSANLPSPIRNQLANVRCATRLQRALSMIYYSWLFPYACRNTFVIIQSFPSSLTTVSACKDGRTCLFAAMASGLIFTSLDSSEKVYTKKYQENICDVIACCFNKFVQPCFLKTTSFSCKDAPKCMELRKGGSTCKHLLFLFVSIQKIIPQSGLVARLMLKPETSCAIEKITFAT